MVSFWRCVSVKTSRCVLNMNISVSLSSLQLRRYWQTVFLYGFWKNRHKSCNYISSCETWWRENKHGLLRVCKGMKWEFNHFSNRSTRWYEKRLHDGNLLPIKCVVVILQLKVVKFDFTDFKFPYYKIRHNCRAHDVPW